MTGNGIYTDEAVAEAKQVMVSRNFHVKTDGSIAHSLATDTVDFLFGAMTSVPVVTDKLRTLYAPVATKSATETYTEEGHFSSNGKKYDLNILFAMIEREAIEVSFVPVSKMDWVLEYDIANEDRLVKADMAVPIIAIPYGKQGLYLVVDGLHRLTKAVRVGMKEMPAYVLTSAQFNSARIS